jgi:hypothetical protein
VAGKQFSFFLGLTDQIAMEEAIRASGDVVILSARSRAAWADEKESSVMHDPENEVFRVLIARRTDLPLIHFHPTHSPDNDFACKVLDQQIVEYDRMVGFKHFIRAGRMYRVDKFWNANHQIVSKSPEFIEWADRLYKLVKRSLTKVEQGFYAGQEALAMRRSGVPFEGLDVEFNSIQE